MAVLEDASFEGHVSGGCVEPAIAAEVAKVIATGQDTILTFGRGSRFIDIRFPCGGGVELLVHVRPDPALLAGAVAHLYSRTPFSLLFSPQENRADLTKSEDEPTGWREGRFVRRFLPRTRVLLIGRGPEFEVTARVALATGLDLSLASPDAKSLHAVASLGVPMVALSVPGQSWDPPIDRWTATVLLFHDHDWESSILARAVRAPGFYVGALGSPKTHRARCEGLAASGVPQDLIDTIHGPIGLFGRARDPGALALSVLGEITRHRMALEAG